MYFDRSIGNNSVSSVFFVMHSRRSSLEKKTEKYKSFIPDFNYIPFKKISEDVLCLIISDVAWEYTFDILNTEGWFTLPDLENGDFISEINGTISFSWTIWRSGARFNSPMTSNMNLA